MGARLENTGSPDYGAISKFSERRKKDGSVQTSKSPLSERTRDAKYGLATRLLSTERGTFG